MSWKSVISLSYFPPLTLHSMTGLSFAVPFSFDPNTSAGRLSVSDDLTSISTGNYKLLVDVPERFSAGLPCTLGSKSFSKGSHAWEVDIGSIDNWCIGVARKQCGYQWSFGSDSYLGFAYTYRMQGDSNKKCQSSKSILLGAASGKDLKKVRVELDCDEGELSFYNAEHKSHIYTFHDNFVEVVPYFCLCGVEPVESSSESLKLCPLQVQIKEDYPDWENFTYLHLCISPNKKNYWDSLYIPFHYLCWCCNTIWLQLLCMQYLESRDFFCQGKLRWLPQGIDFGW